MKRKSKETVYGQTFDLALRFNGSIKDVELFIDENVQLVLEGLLKENKTITIQTNWWSKDLKIYSDNPIQNNKEILQ